MLVYHKIYYFAIINHEEIRLGWSICYLVEKIPQLKSADIRGE
jgi:hypothetical protein